MRIIIRNYDIRGAVQPLDDADWATIQMASYLHGRTVTDEEVNQALALTIQEQARLG